jgi:hypothetical protein
VATLLSSAGTHAHPEGATEPRLAIQRHQGVDGFREKPELESPELRDVPELQVAVSSAARALEAGKSSGPGVARLQEVLRRMGYPAPASTVYDPATKSVVAKFQADHGIPFPTGRQAGPKTLSTLDDHLLKEPPPEDDELGPGEVPGRMSGTTTKRAEANSKGTVKQRPEGKVTLDSTKELPAKTKKKEPLVQGEVAIQGQLTLFTTEKDHKRKLCDSASVEASGVVNFRVLPLGDRVVILSDPTLSLNVLPSLCKDPHEFPTLKLQLDVVKVMISEQVEVALAAGAGVKDALRQQRGWLESGITVGVKLGEPAGIPTKIELGINGELPIAREPKPDGTFDDHAEVHFVTGFVFSF